jgi:hypothetical protein
VLGLLCPPGEVLGRYASDPGHQDDVAILGLKRLSG